MKVMLSLVPVEVNDLTQLIEQSFLKFNPVNLNQNILAKSKFTLKRS